MNELAAVIADAFGKPLDVQHLEARHEVEFAWSDHSKARQVFGAAPETSLADGIGRMAKWAMDVGPRESSRFDEIEIQRHLPSSWRM